MATERLSMRQIREVLRQKWEQKRSKPPVQPRAYRRERGHVEGEGWSAGAEEDR